MVNSAKQIVRQPAVSVRAAYLAIAAAFAALVLLLSLHVLSPEYSPAWRMISEYANGRHSFVLSLMFLAYGLTFVALAYAIRTQLSTRSGKIGLGFLVAAGLGAASAAQFDLNQATLHDLAGVVGVLCLPIGAVLISRDLAKRTEWTSAGKLLVWMSHATWISILLFGVTFVLMVVTFLHALGGLPNSAPAEVPAGVIALVGWTDRLLVLAAWAWAVVTAYEGIKVARSSQARSSGANRGIAGSTVH